MSFKGFTYALRPKPEQIAQMAQFAGVCRLVWNLALKQRQDHWRHYETKTGKRLNHVAQSRDLKVLRADYDFIRAVHYTPLQKTLEALEKAYQRAWKGLGGYPKPKRKGEKDAFSYSGREISVEKLNRRWGRVRLPKIGWVKFRLTRPLRGKICEATVIRTAIGWQISIICETNEVTSDNGSTVGIDRGVTVPVMLSDGTCYYLPVEIERHGKSAKKAQRIASRRKRGSRRQAKAKRRVAALKARQARARKHWAHKTTTDIARKHGGVVVEALRTRNMTASAAGTNESPGTNVAQKRGLNRAILNVGWFQIETMLAYKAARFEKVSPSYSSQTCSSCGTVDKRSRESQAVFVCSTCGFRDNADRNAAAVILKRGNTPGVEDAGYGSDEARTGRAAA